MIDEIVANSPIYGQAIAHHAGVPFQCIDSSFARVVDGDLYGGVVYNGYTEASMMIHSAAFHDRWINRDLLWITFDYPFNQLGVHRLFGQVPADNLAALKFNRNLGFRTVAIIEGVYKDDVACHVMRMDREDCRFLKIRPRHIRRNSH